MVIRKTRAKAEFGDFQTPLDLAQRICLLLRDRGVNPASVVEPTCGKGSFLVAAGEAFHDVHTFVGLEVNEAHLITARRALTSVADENKFRLLHGDFFRTDWIGILESLPDPLLVIGNLPWVTNSDLGSMSSANLPVKTNFQNRRGLDALTGKSNFDISEWMLIRALEWLDGRQGVLAILCKTAVARRVLAHHWRNGRSLGASDMYLIDAQKWFCASVDACLLMVSTMPGTAGFDCTVHSSLEGTASRIIAHRDGLIVADLEHFERHRHLLGNENGRWRSGIKHDCARIMEFTEENGRLRNGLGEPVDIEPDYLYPLLKSSDVANREVAAPHRWMLVTQRNVGDDTDSIAAACPKTWSYLLSHASLLDGRASSIYRGRPRYAVFGVGDYSFSPYKVAISGLYKKIQFKAVGMFQGKPIMLDDTCYFCPCATQDEAEYVAELLNFDTARDFFSAFVFWDAKRPINIEILKLLDLGALARELNPSRATDYFRPVQAALRI